MSKALAEKAVQEGRLYAGSTGCSVRDAQRIYGRWQRAIATLNKKMGGDYTQQIVDEVNRRGPIAPLAGKDY